MVMYHKSHFTTYSATMWKFFSTFFLPMKVTHSQCMPACSLAPNSQLDGYISPKESLKTFFFQNLAPPGSQRSHTIHTGTDPASSAASENLEDHSTLLVTLHVGHFPTILSIKRNLSPSANL